MKKQSLKKAVELMGGQTALANSLNITQAHIWNWLNRDQQVPAEYVISIEKLTGIPRHEFRPDIYPPEEYKQAS